MTSRNRALMDCETNGLHPGRRAYEVGLILRQPGKPDEEFAWFIDIEDLDLVNAEPIALEVGRFWRRHPQAHLVPLVGNLAGITPDLPETPPTARVYREVGVLHEIAHLTAGKAYIMGSNPAFDTQTLAARMAVYDIKPDWHYHPIDVPDRAAGWLAGQGREVPTNEKGDEKSDLIAKACGVDPADYARHEALGDCRLFRDLWDVIQKPRETPSEVPSDGSGLRYNPANGSLVMPADWSRRPDDIPADQLAAILTGAVDLADGIRLGHRAGRATGRAQALLDVGEAMSPTGEWPPEALDEVVGAVRSLATRIDDFAAAKDALTQTLALRDGVLAESVPATDTGDFRDLSEPPATPAATDASVAAALDMLDKANRRAERFAEQLGQLSNGLRERGIRITPDGFVAAALSTIDAFQTALDEATQDGIRDAELDGGLTAEQEIRAIALPVAGRLVEGMEHDGETIRDVEQTTIGVADRYAEWIATGSYEWMADNPAQLLGRLDHASRALAIARNDAQRRHTQGYAEAVRRLRDDNDYRAWSGDHPDLGGYARHVREAFATYVEQTAPDPDDPWIDAAPRRPVLDGDGALDTDRRSADREARDA